MTICRLCKTMFKVFQLLCYLTFLWMVVSMVMEMAPFMYSGFKKILPLYQEKITFSQTETIWKCNGSNPLS